MTVKLEQKFKCLVVIAESDVGTSFRCFNLQSHTATSLMFGPGLCERASAVSGQLVVLATLQGLGVQAWRVVLVAEFPEGDHASVQGHSHSLPRRRLKD